MDIIVYPIAIALERMREIPRLGVSYGIPFATYSIDFPQPFLFFSFSF